MTKTKGDDRLKHHIDIDEIDNGFTVKLFDEDGKAELDKTVFVPTWKEIMPLLETWHKQQLKTQAEESE